MTKAMDSDERLKLMGEAVLDIVSLLRTALSYRDHDELERIRQTVFCAQQGEHDQIQHDGRCGECGRVVGPAGGRR